MGFLFFPALHYVGGFKHGLWFCELSLCLERESNAGSVTHLVTNEHPVAIAPALQRLSEDASNHYKSQPTLNHSPVYNNIYPGSQTLSKSHSYAENINMQLTNGTDQKQTKINVEDLHLDPVVLRENHILANMSERTKYVESKLDNDLTAPEKENNLMSASRLKLLQDTTMIESALDLDSLEDSSVGANSQAGLMKVLV